MAAPTPVDLDIVAQIPVFSGLKPGTLAVLLGEATVLNLRQGRALFRQGEQAQAFFVIMEGWIKLYRVTPAGDEAVLNVLTRGESFAEAVTFTSGRYPATASAVTLARVMMIPADHVVNCIREMPDVAIAMIASTSQHLQRMVQQIEQLMAHSATQRVAEFLVSLAPRAKGPCRITLPYDKSLIAGRLGLKPESLSRVFAKLRAAGVDVHASTVEVRDMAQLCKLVACDRTMARCPVKPRPICAQPPRPLDLDSKSMLAGAGS
ncbi:Crp/Fnr family transcriptional regulator [Bradyrhizobium arachidis]|uniref:Crp/Fnr family transcriptional regulator n=1 Tax=Bradyrhizobium TaxID=374 RepID=UPI00188D20AA|nr:MULTISPECIES: Crp/Fnr family transcriptional regulator [Bradyrhizobium]QOZ51764.1 Crp/Fnr family transcriptional regulator [Bradyrhizobium sp. CCBAU 53338]UVO38934.1 Crp/Fnr family transcriptional regulator [Bradyrhizobium arachidis]